MFGLKNLFLTCLCTALSLCVVSPVHVEAGEAQDALFDRGVALYEEGRYEDAVESFSELLALDVETADVHYNLANSWFKAGRLGPAIFHYRRAHALAPRDDDIAANLEYARFLALDRVEEEGGATTDRKVDGLLDRITAAEAFRISAVLWILAGLAGVVWQLEWGGGLARRFFWGFLAGWVVVFSGAWFLHARSQSLNEAVVMAQEAQIRNGPGATFDTAFVLHEGAEVVVEAERGRWTEISLPGDLRGWIDSESIGRL